ncbi:enoyl-CoA hydratase-related protein [Labrys wisconsinensis]|uniref:2-(1,2-epoxy-1,2-dihydrophenyl)acetyl-CoA isomerase n=1 Tax=Labrys wisconsinensis TaxID=425677 RepID=A0ABU0J9R2_9HYPH|nr:enoyl-CoA hydratase-related protein [Labrys wisconsinensis]MDQ0471004.1 2-(1,2-epoxy-1,2-dihydrophenyl)acetyl-CoA isomerase [Labrys wisconsinensis]
MTTIESTTLQGVRTLTLNRPDKLNAFNAAMHAELREALAAAAVDHGVKAVVLTGAGRAFSSGQDLTEDLPRDGEGRVDLGPPLERDYNPLVLALATYPKPTIAALNGPAVGAAMNIALACDIVLAARSAMLQEAFARIALMPDAGGTWLLPRLVGPKRALALMMTAEPVPAEEALRLGLVHKLFDDAVFAAEVAAFAVALARGPAFAYRLIKEAVLASATNDLATQLAVEARLQKQAGFSHDFAEGVAAFREKRPPRFEGR